jgi:hypothetical protein
MSSDHSQAKKGDWVVNLGVVVVKMYSLISQYGIPVHCTVVYSRWQVCNSKEDKPLGCID